MAGTEIIKNPVVYYTANNMNKTLKQIAAALLLTVAAVGTTQAATTPSTVTVSNVIQNISIALTVTAQGPTNAKGTSVTFDRYQVTTGTVLKDLASLGIPIGSSPKLVWVTPVTNETAVTITTNSTVGGSNIVSSGTFYIPTNIGASNFYYGTNSSYTNTSGTATNVYSVTSTNVTLLATNARTIQVLSGPSKNMVLTNVSSYFTLSGISGEVIFSGTGKGLNTSDASFASETTLSVGTLTVEIYGTNTTATNLLFSVRGPLKGTLVADNAQKGTKYPLFNYSLNGTGGAEFGGTYTNYVFTNAVLGVVQGSVTVTFLENQDQ